MGRIKDYPLDEIVSLDDTLLATDYNDANKTKNISVGSLIDLIVGGNYANDTLAAAGGILLGQMYHTSGTVKIRLV
jgi:hypothetical protein